MMWLCKTALLAASAILFIWYLSQIELADLQQVIGGLGFWAPLVLVPYLIVYLVDSLAWRQTLPGIKCRFLDLFRIRWAGESVNNVVPSAYVGGEAVKVWLLRREGVDVKAGATSVLVSKTAQTIAQVFFIICASLVLFSIAREQPGMLYGISIVLAAAFAAVGGLCWVQKVGLFRVALSLSRMVPVARNWVARNQEKLLEFDQTTFRFYRSQKRRFGSSVALFFLGWMLDTLEIYFVAYLLGLPISWAQALVVEAFAGIVKVAGMWVPGSLGVQESGIVVMCRLAGVPDGLGVGYALIRRVRDLIFAGIGWYFLYRAGTNLRAIHAEARKQIYSRV